MKKGKPEKARETEVKLLNSKIHNLKENTKGTMEG